MIANNHNWQKGENWPAIPVFGIEYEACERKNDANNR